MPQWLVIHIDALIPGVLGLFLCVKGFLMPAHDSSSLDAAKKRNTLRICGVALVVIGIARFFTDSMGTASQPRAVPEYEPSTRNPPANFKPIDPAEIKGPVTITTDDGMASAEFPQAPVREAATDEDGVRYSRVTWGCKLEGDKIGLRLSHSQYEPKIKEMTPAQLFPLFEKAFEQEGMVVSRRTDLSTYMRETVLDRPYDGGRIVVRMWLGPGGIYRAIATTEKGFHDDPRVLRFISSFGKAAAAKGE